MKANSSIEEKLDYLVRHQPILFINSPQPDRSKVRAWVDLYDQTARRVIALNNG